MPSREYRKRKGNGKMLPVVLGLVLTLGLTACGGGSSSGESFAAMDAAQSAYKNNAGGAAMGDSYYFEEAAEDASYGSGSSVNQGGTTVTENAVSDRKMIRTVNLEVETQEYEALLGSVEQKVMELGGYIQNMESYNGSNYNNSKGRRYANLTLRIPKDNMNSFINNIAQNSNVVRRTESMEDVTLQYVDLSSHKKALQAEYDRLLVLMDRTETTEDIYLLEQRLAEVRYQIESMESQLRTYDNKVDYSTIYLYINEVEIYTPVREETVWERISNGFVESVKDVADGLVDFVVWFIGSIPYLLVWAVVIAGIVLIIRAIIRKARKKKAKKQAAEPAGMQQQQQTEPQHKQYQAIDAQRMQQAIDAQRQRQAEQAGSADAEKQKDDKKETEKKETNKRENENRAAEKQEAEKRKADKIKKLNEMDRKENQNKNEKK